MKQETIDLIAALPAYWSHQYPEATVVLANGKVVERDDLIDYYQDRRITILEDSNDLAHGLIHGLEAQIENLQSMLATESSPGLEEEAFASLALEVSQIRLSHGVKLAELSAEIGQVISPVCTSERSVSVKKSTWALLMIGFALWPIIVVATLHFLTK